MREYTIVVVVVEDMPNLLERGADNKYIKERNLLRKLTWWTLWQRLEEYCLRDTTNSGSHTLSLGFKRDLEFLFVCCHR